MSLNGLDNAAITEAFQAARAENGGWLLLRYTTRDEVELLKTGKGGVSDLRDAVAAYTEESPLYGFLRFRRRSVLVKYIPEGTSRLLQARVTVHFQSILDKFSPHDTIFPITVSTDLKETKLSAACSLHAASNSTSSSNSSLPRPHLSEIIEDTEENRISKVEGEKPLPALPNNGPSFALIERNVSIRTHSNGETSMGIEQVVGSAVQTAAVPPKGQSERPATRDTMMSRNYEDSIASRPVTSSGRDQPHSALFRAESTRDDLRARRPSTSSSLRPAVRELYDNYAGSIKTKVKLGPRPSLDAGGRPQTATSDRKVGPRPVSALPAGLKLAPRKAFQPIKTRAMHSAPIVATVPIVMTSTRSPGFETDFTPALSPPSRPLTSPQSIKSSTASLRFSSVISNKTPGMTPEKQRLMKALALRKRRIDLAASPLPATTSNNEGQSTGINRPRALPEPVEASLNSAAAYSTDPAAPTQSALPLIAETPPTETNVLESGRPAEECSEEKANSSPTSMVESPELTSTKASSISDHTEEPYLQAIDNLPMPDESTITVTEVVPNVAVANKSPSHSPSLGSTVRVELPNARCSPDGIETLLGGVEPKDIEPESGTDGIVPEKPRFESDEANAPPSEDTPKVAQAPEILADVRAVTDAASDRPEGTIIQDRMVLETFGMGNKKAVAIVSVNTDVDPDALVQSGGATPRNAVFDDGILQQRASTSPSSPPEDINGKSGYWSGTSISESVHTSKRNSLEHLDAPKSKKRRSGVKPIRTDLTPDDSSDNLLSGDSFMSELEAATVLEAKPVSVRRSPLAATFAIAGQKTGSPWMTSRTASNPSIQSSQGDSSTLDIPRESRGRSISGSIISTKSEKQGSPVAVIKKINVSSGISQRIKALEEISNLTSSHSPQIASLNSPTTSPSSIRMRQASVQLPSRGNQSPNFGNGSQAAFSSPTPNDPGAHASRPRMFDGANNSHRAESVSVKARILRDPKQVFSQLLVPVVDSSESVELRESPISIEHHQGLSRSNDRLGASHGDRPISIASAKQISRSASASPGVVRRPSAGSRHSGSSGKHDTTVMDERKEHKKESTTSRIFRRMSSISGGSRKSINYGISPTLPEEEHTVDAIASPAPEPSVTEVGEVNVQFPDSLLWKRRALLVDGQGYINLVPSKYDENSRTSTKRYHLSEFNAPFIPDQDRQELPNSVILDIHDGGTLQCACEHQAGQAYVLQCLRKSYQQWAS